MKDLIQRLEAAEAGSRELDVEIAKLLGVYIRAWGLPPYHPTENVSPYTTSLDAALTLVPEGLASAVGTMFGMSQPPWGVVWQANGRPMATCEAATPALALCIAALKAREASHD